MILSIVAALIAAPHAAAPAPPAQPSGILVNGQRNHGDPNRKICKDLGQPGSRLSVERVCRTASEWEAEKAQNKQLLLLKQTNGAQ